MTDDLGQVTDLKQACPGSDVDLSPGDSIFTAWDKDGVWPRKDR